jgi:hypothetical protein
MRIRTILFSSAVACLFLVGCVSTSDDFLLRSLDDQAKAKALVDQGIAEYQLQLVKREDYTKIAVVRQYFVVALSYDPDNLLANQYRDLVDNFKTTRLRDKLKEANTYLAKVNRKEDENYAMCLAVQAVYRIDPSNAAVVKLVNDTAPMRQTLASTYLSRARASLAKMTTTTPVATQDALYLDAFQNITKLVAIDPQNSDAKALLSTLKIELGKIFTRHSDTLRTLIAAAKFDNGKTEVAYLTDINRKLGGTFDAQLKTAGYSLYYQWARNLVSRKDYTQADAKLTTAISFSRTDEALALKKSIADAVGRNARTTAQATQAASQAAQAASFDSALQEIDGLIAQAQSSLDSFADANAKINSLVGATTDQANLDQLESRRQKLQAFLKDYYDKAVAFYRSENFKDAIEILQVIVQVSVDYEQAADYLNKAQAKQKLLDQY